MKIRDINVDAHLLLGKKYLSGGDPARALEQFKLANTHPDNQQAGRDLNDHRVPQILYYIGQACDELGKKKDAKESYKKCIAQDIEDSEFSYYQGLACMELGEDAKAAELFDALVREGKQTLEQGEERNIFAKFGESVSENASRSSAHLKIGLGHLGKKELQPAIEHLQKAVELDVSNLWAGVLLEDHSGMPGVK